MKISSEEIRNNVIQAVARSLAINGATIKDSDRLISDLGMDSLDFLDIMFALEKTFGVKIRDDEFDSVLKPSNAADGQKEFLTREEIERVSFLIPELTKAAEDRRIMRKDFFSYITVDTLVKMVAKKVDEPGNAKGG